MKVIDNRLDVTGDIQIHIFADEHLGDSLSDFRRLQERIKYVAETPNAFCVFGGDLLDTAIASSIGDTYAATFSPREALIQCEKIFAPVAPKVLGVVGGNHERRVYRSDGIDLTEIMCSQLGILDKYSPTTALIYVRFGKDKGHGGNRQLVYSMYLTHGSRGGRRPGGKVNALEDLSRIVDADIYIMNHTHSPAVIRQDYFRADSQSATVRRCEHLFVNSAANLDYGGYGDIAGYVPSSMRSPVITLADGQKYAYATL